MFIEGLYYPKAISNTLLILIPKVPNPTSFSEYRLISLCTCFNKIVSKLITTRLAVVLPKLISSEQSGFIRGREIVNVLLAQELVSSMNHSNRGGTRAIKLDMEKAYDRLD